MKRVEVKVYEFNELSDPIKHKLMEREYESQVDVNFEVFGSNAEDDLANSLGIEAKVYYSLGYQQGDGLHFVTNRLLTTRFREDVEAYLPTKEAVTHFRELCATNEFSAKTRSSVNRYEYASARDVRFSLEDREFDATDPCELIEYLSDLCGLSRDEAKSSVLEIIRGIQQAYLNLCAQLEKRGYQCYDVPPEQLVESLSDFYYYPDGRVYGLIDET